MRDTVINKTMDGKLIAIVRGMEENKILPLTEALYNGGIGMIEVTFNQSRVDSFKATARAISAIKKHFQEDMLPGAGTVLTFTQLEMAADAGAMYIISPNVDESIIKRTREMGLVSMPGAFTPSECQQAHNAGADFVKLFPAADMGPGYLKAICAPLSHIRFLCVGGINEKNLGDYLKAGATGFGIGGNLVNKTLIDAGEFKKITELAKAYVNAVKQG